MLESISTRDVLAIAKQGDRFYQDFVFHEDDVFHSQFDYVSMTLESHSYHIRSQNFFIYKIEQIKPCNEEINSGIGEKYRLHFIKMGKPKIIRLKK